MKPESLLSLCQELALEFQRDPKGPRVAAMLANYADKHQDWRRWALFDKDCYTRNLVHRDEQFELLLLCWDADQASPIHNHEGQRCWMAVLEGQVSETLFHLAKDEGLSPVPLTAGNSRICVPGQVAFITDEIALHEIASAGGKPAVSLHLYAQPFATCQVYDRESGRISVRQLSYYSVCGVRAAAVRPV
jgi:cysteine dioxygenase